MTPQRLADALETLADGPPWDTGWLRTILPELAVRGRLVKKEAGADWIEGSFDTFGTVNPKIKRDADEIESGFLPMANVPVVLGEAIRFERKHWGEIKAGFTRFEEGDLLVAKITPCFQNGKACVAREVPGGVGAGTTELYVFRPHPDLGNVDFFHLLVRTPKFVQGGVDTFTGTAGQQRVSKTYFAGHTWSIPPLAEQHRIVAKVDELMGHAAVLEERHLAAASARVRLRDAALHALAEAEDHEAVETAWQQIEEHFEDLFTEPEDVAPLRQTILQLAVRGRLARQEEGDGEQQIGRPDLRMPQGWRVARFEECAWVASALVDPADHADAVHVAPDTIEAGTGQLLQCRTIQEDRVTSPKHKFVTGQILYSKIRPALSKCVIAPFDGLCSADMYPIETTQVVRYLQLAMLSRDFVVAASAMANRVKMPKINKSELDSIDIPLPPLAEQHRIVAKVDELMALYTTLEATLTRAKAAREQFAASISDAISEASLPIPTIGSRG